MTIKTKLTEGDYINVHFVLLYRKFSTKLLTIIALSILIVSIIELIAQSQFSYKSQFIVSFGLLSFLPLITYFAAKRNYISNRRISEQMEYSFDNEFLSISGESFISKLTWEKVYKVSKTKNWIFIWQSKQSANIMHRKDFTNSQLEDLKSILISENIKNNL